MSYPQASLLGLPAELRLQIYSHLLDSTSLHLIHHLNQRRPSYKGRNPGAWLQICHQIRHELRLAFYSTVTFTLTDNLDLEELRSWLAIIGPEAVQSLRRVVVCGGENCTFLGDIPGTYWCERRVTHDLYIQRPTVGDLVCHDNLVATHELCSKRWPDCWDANRDAYLAAATAKHLSKPERLVAMWQVLNTDNIDDDWRDLM